MKKKKLSKAAELTRSKVKIKNTYNFDNKRVKVSIIVPVCNVESYLCECLDSIVCQTLKDIEIICVNDGSTDSSLDILLDYCKKDHRIKIIDKENAGYGHSINLGIDFSSGDYIGIVESDDFIHNKMYESLYEVARNNNLDFVKSDFFKFTTEKDKKQYNRVFLTNDKNYYNNVFAPNDKPECYDFPMYTWTGVYKASFLRKHNIRHNESPGASFQDTGFFFQTFAFGKKVQFLDKAFYYYRCDNPNSSVKSKNKVYCIKYEYEYVIDLLKKHPQIYDQIIKYVWSVRGSSYIRTLNRVDKKFRHEFIRHFRSVFLIAEKKGELDFSIMPSDRANTINTILRIPQKYLYMMDHKNLKRPIFRRFLWCMNDNGFLYSVRYLYKRMSAKPWTYRSAIKAHSVIQIHKLLSVLHLFDANMKEIRRFKNIHNGDRCFIVCTGPSLRMSDLDRLHNEYTIGVNSIYRAYPNTTWRPTYYTIIDQYIAEKYTEGEKLDFASFAKDAVFLNSYIKTDNDPKIKRLYIDFKNHEKKNMDYPTLFVSEDLSIRAIDCFTVTNIAISLAIYMGFKKIYLLGADNNFEGSKIHFLPNSFDPNTAKKGRMEINTVRATYGYFALKEFAKYKNVEIYNATRGGHLEVFDRVDFDDVIQNMSDYSAWDEFIELIMKEAKNKEIILWGNSIEFRKRLKNAKGIEVRNAFKNKKLCDGIHTLCLDDLNNKKDIYYLINVDSEEDAEKIKILKEIGFYSKGNYKFLKHKDMIVNSAPYSDAYGNTLNCLPKNFRVHFEGYNSKLIIGKKELTNKCLDLHIGNNSKVVIEDNVFLNGTINIGDNSSLTIKAGSKFTSCKIVLDSKSSIYFGEKFESEDGLEVFASKNSRIYVGKDTSFEKNVSLICGRCYSVYNSDMKNIDEDMAGSSISVHSHVRIGRNSSLYSGTDIGVGAMVSEESIIRDSYYNNTFVKNGTVVDSNVFWKKNERIENNSPINIEYRLKTVEDIRVV